MKKYTLLILIMCLLFAFAGCTKSGTVEQELNTNLEFQILDNVTDKDFSEYVDVSTPMTGTQSYYGKEYKTTTDKNGNVIRPEHVVIYHVGGYPDILSKEKYIVGIIIADPSVNIYGITLNTSFDEIKSIMNTNGYTEKEVQKENVMQYKKDKITITFDHADNIISIDAMVTNESGIVF